MNLNLTYKVFSDYSESDLCASSNNLAHGMINEIIFDSRRIVFVENVLFIALKGDFRDGHDFIEDAYKKGIRTFLISKKIDFEKFPLATFFSCKDVLLSIQKLASKYREKANVKIIAVAGSHGKTTVKECLYFFLSDKFRVYRSPKSYNSQLGVPISLLQISDNVDYAIIEVGVSLPGEISSMKKMINPDYGILTCFSPANINDFLNQKKYEKELFSLLKGVEGSVVTKQAILSNAEKKEINLKEIDSTEILKNISDLRWLDSKSSENLSLAIEMAKILGVNTQEIIKKIPQMPNLAMRLETYDGIEDSVIINDTYNLDVNALSNSLSYQKAIAENRKRIVLLAMDDEFEKNKEEIRKEIYAAKPDVFLELKTQKDFELNIKGAVVLLKGSQKSFIRNIAQQIKKQTHSTTLEINFSALKENLSFFRKKIKSETKMLCMVKAQSYGSGLEKMGVFLEKQGVSYLGVACVDEGVELRKCGITTPILVLNMQQENFKSCIENNLEPAIYSFIQLDAFIRELIDHKKNAYPIHLKFDTGMHRLGFDINDTNQIIEMIKSQPEILIRGVFSHLADSGSTDKSFTIKQISLFEKIKQCICANISSPVIFHLLNTDGIINYNSSQNDMVRLGIGMYGISSKLLKELKPVFSWNTTVSQVKKIEKGGYIGYSKAHKTNKTCTIAIIPVGYGDGFRRTLNNGRGGVYIKNKYCQIVGNVCMDMTMVEIGENDIKEGDLVEIIGENQTINDLAFSMQTIPYEILTGISKRVHRIYIED